MPKITKIQSAVPQIKKRKRVAGYARVSMETERMQHSLSAQISYYNELIQKNPEWEYAGVYSDDFVSGTTTTKREGFQKLIRDCDAGAIDIILTKSISRFARNTVDLLETVRHLKEIGVEVWFEKENIHSLSTDGELMLTILASYAQEEAISISQNVQWVRRKNFEKGIPQARYRVLGYRWVDWDMVIIPEEAAVVREIFERYLRGDSHKEILEWLETNGIKSSAGRTMTKASLYNILRNETYVGDLVLQKSYVADNLTHHRKMNYGELPKYVVDNHHEGIISRETFRQAQEKAKAQKEDFFFINTGRKRTCFTSKIRCGHCGCSFFKATIHRPSQEGYIYWRCSMKQRKGGDVCPCKGLPHTKLLDACCEVLGVEDFDEDIFMEKIDHLVMQEDGKLRFYFKDGREELAELEQSPQDLGWDRRREAESNAKES